MVPYVAGMDDALTEERRDHTIELGFIEEIEDTWKAHRCFFPSKVGGKPAWLDPKNIPSCEQLSCSSCGKPMSFLLQLYAADQSDANAFHRTLFIFCCKNGSCYKTNSNQCFKVLRCQLERDNEFYQYDPPDYDSSTYHLSVKEYDNTCQVCGCHGTKVCARCSSVRYCSKEHQIYDWKKHKPVCGKTDNSVTDDETRSGILFPEKEIVIEDEDKNELDEAGENTQDGAPGDMSRDISFSPTELEQFANHGDNDESFQNFKRSILDYPDQVIRYEKGGEPLWCSSEYTLSCEDIPNCPCGAKRQFELQVMPQLLNHLAIQSSPGEPCIDWGILAIFTCPKNCTGGGPYAEEYVHKQDFSQ